MTPKSLTVLSPTAILGYGFPLSSFERGMAMKPDVIAVDAGSVDPGPFYLGSGKSFTDRAAVKRDLLQMIIAGVQAKIPVIVGSAGGSGAKAHLDWTLEIVQELLVEQGITAKLGVITADIDKQAVINGIESHKVTALAGLAPLVKEEVEATTSIVAQMGVEPFIEALDAGCQIILAGRAYDPAVFAALPIKCGFDAGLAIHMGKILECAAIAAEPGSGADCVVGVIDQSGFTLISCSDERQFTEDSVAAHTLYEKSNPYLLPGPGGYLDLTQVVFSALGNGQVRVTGSRFVKDDIYRVKLEGARLQGYRTVSIAGIRDPIMINTIDDILTTIKDKMCTRMEEDTVEAFIDFHVYGKNGVMGQQEPMKITQAHELGVVIEVVASEQAIADSMCSLTRSTLLHFGYPNRIATAGNLAFPFSPSDLSAGPVYCFSMYHLIEMQDFSFFKLKVIES
ncbi:acyclic terpene utilization AtuA family protein [uncultured Shewanella sp.]|uniref:acyclic terpene utilization AtuA family protein n=1 Tax=uncultured Shewanella sp. TaxID=173975 RepID=UPI0026249260|nr:acyclic terpene utilization AtuA family protein [uncultured Shewanella sp.]